MKKSRIEAARKPGEAENFRQNPHSHACQKMPNRKWRLEMRKHNEEMRKGTIDAERKQRQAENFRQNPHSHACQKVPRGNDH
jgi:hypothetical protein